MSWLLPRMVGINLAAELMLVGRFVAAVEADQCGIATLVGDGDVIDAALSLSAEITDRGPHDQAGPSGRTSRRSRSKPH